MTPAQRKAHLVIWLLVIPVSALMLLIGWFAASAPVTQGEVVPPSSLAPEGGIEGAP